MFLLTIASWALLPLARARADDDDHHDDDDDDHKKKRRRKKKARRERNERKRRKFKRDREDEENHDFEEAARARKSGAILPLEEILKEIRKTYKGEIVGVEFEKKNGIWIYEIKMISPKNRFFELYIDATTKKIIKVWGK